MVYVPIPLLNLLCTTALVIYKPTLKGVIFAIILTLPALAFIFLVRRSIQKHGFLFPDKVTWRKNLYDGWLMWTIFGLMFLIQKQWLWFVAFLLGNSLLGFIIAPGIMNLMEGTRRRVEANVNRIIT